jgi:hypothetical protein
MGFMNIDFVIKLQNIYRFSFLETDLPKKQRIPIQSADMIEN